MALVNYTPYMNLPNPIPGDDTGPDYAINIQSCFNIVDQHNHSPGSGQQINPSGILINADLPFSSNNATQLRSVRFTPQTTPLSLASDIGCLYESGVDLYYNDGNGNQVRITSGGTVNATSSGITNGTASASFSGGVLIVDEASNTPGNIQCGSVLIGNNTVGSNFVTLSAPNSLGTDYTLTLPTALPSTNGALIYSSSAGALSSLPLGSAGQTLLVGPASAPVWAGANYVVSSSCGVYGYSGSGLIQQITNLAVTLSTIGNPVQLSVQPDGSTNFASYAVGGGSNEYAGFYFYKNSELLAKFLIPVTEVSSGTFTFTDFNAASGSNEYQVYVQSLSGITAIDFFNYVLSAIEIF